MTRCLLLALLWSCSAYGLEQYTLETVRYDIIAPPGSKDVRLFWEGQIRNNTSCDAALLPTVLLLDENDTVLRELSLPQVLVPRFGKETRKDIFLVDQEVWRRTKAIGGKASPDAKTEPQGFGIDE